MKLTLKTATTFLSSMPNATKEQRSTFDACVELGFTRLQNHRDAKLLSHCVNAAMDSQGYSGTRARKYIESHASVVWQSDKRAYKLAEGELLIAARELAFYAWEQASNPPSTTTRKMESVLNGMIKSLNDLVKSDRIDDKKRAQKVLEMLRNA